MVLSGMEKMLASMIGMTPDEMQAMVKGMTGAVHETLATMKRIEAGMASLSERMEALENAGRK